MHFSSTVFLLHGTFVLFVVNSAPSICAKLGLHFPCITYDFADTLLT